MSTGYRPPSAEPRGRWARHIHAKRREWGWSQTRGFEAVREGLGLGPKSRAAYISLDQGPRTPTPAEEQALAAVYGWPEESPVVALEATETPAGDIGALVAELREQNRHMAALLTELREYRLMTGDALRAQHATQTGIEEAILALGTAMGATIPLGRERPEQRPGGQGSEGRARGAAI